jgi:hypothetical protein
VAQRAIDLLTYHDVNRYLHVNRTRLKPVSNPYLEILRLWDHRNHLFKAVPTMCGCMGRLRCVRDNNQLRGSNPRLPQVLNFVETYDYLRI